MLALITVALAGLTLIGVGLAAGGNYVGRPSKRPRPSGPPPSRPRPPPSGSKVRRPRGPGQHIEFVRGWGEPGLTGWPHYGQDDLEREADEAITGMHLALILHGEIVDALGQQQYGAGVCRHLRCGPRVYSLIYSLLPSGADRYRLAIWKGVRVVEVEGMVGWSLCKGDCRPARPRGPVYLAS